MIPRRLRIRNFLSYRDCEVDLTGLRLAVLCGPNGNGKSALLDAMTWALWGEGRGRLEDDRIHLGEHDMLVDFEFESSGDLFKVIRKRTRGKASGSLEFLQVTPEGGRTTLTGGVVSETQAEIIRKLRMDYDTFVNSAFIAQGRANEFTKKRPAERKEVFRNVLGLERYQEVAEAAAERRKDAVAALKEIERNVGEAAGEIQHLPALRARLEQATAERETLEPDLKRLDAEVVELRQAAADHARLQREAVEALRTVDSLRETTERLAHTIGQLETELAAVQDQLDRAPEVRRAHALLEQLREEEQAMAALQQQGLALQATINEADRRISVERARIETDLKANQASLQAAEASAASLPALLQQQGALTGQQAEVQKLVDESEALEAKAADLRTRAAREGEKANEAARQNTALKEREAQLDTAEAACPVCLKPLAAGDMDHVREEYERQREELRGRYETCRAAKASALDEADRITAASTARRDDARRRETALRERERTLMAQLPAAQEAERALPALRETVAALAASLTAEDFAADARAERAAAAQQLKTLGYDGEGHAAVRAQLGQYAGLDADYRALVVAEERATATRERLVREREELAARRCELSEAEAKLIAARDSLAMAEDVGPRLSQVQDELDSVRRREAELLVNIGQAQARHEALTLLESKLAVAQDQVAEKKEEESVYGDLAKAFGRDGIQAMLIDQSLPRVEHTANDMLDRMTGGRIHVNLATQRQSASGKVTETLDIRISDEIGTRDYEMYSGGEAFRVDFALRIALARLLAERAGATLPTLIIDEGFGTQDAEGIDRLVQAITAVQDEFRLILVVTHIEDLKERFERRIEVTKDHAHGSLARVL